MKRLSGFLVILFLSGQIASAQLISDKASPKSILIGSSQQPPVIICDDQDDWLVQKASSLLIEDIAAIIGKTPSREHQLSTGKKYAIIVGTLRSKFIQELARSKAIRVDDLKNKWEAFQLTTINGYKGMQNVLVIAGSDKRGAAYGVFELSRQMGVSPWYWWADVPAKKKNEIYLNKGNYFFGSPSVKYRGIFINDEAPAFSGWAKEKFGGVNHLVYEKIFELLLRMKGNYLWPAMWGNAFNDDDSLNPILADKWGIVMGTSHHEPMLRAQQEWKRYGKGQWNYDSNEVVLKDFWRKGIQNMGTHESIVTVGMRGDGDMPMTRGTATQLLERIVTDQRKIIAEVTRKDPSQTPQLWALYKEVQDYYDKGMRVPDDVTLLLCDDNWGNIRRLPKLTDPPRKGGYGIYYHFDYVGGPRNYKWINTNNIARVWEQMHLAYEYGVRQIWIVNVGDLKPMEFPISFFLDYAWNTKAWNENNLRDYYTKWSAEQFGPSYAEDIGEVILKYSQFAARRKPELLSPETYSLDNYDEAVKLFGEYRALLFIAQKIDAELPAQYKDAYFQLVLHPVLAAANLNELYLMVALNKHAAKENSPHANALAESAKKAYEKDSLISRQYHNIANGKWNHMMDQTHIGYTYWQQPPVNRMPQVTYVKTDSLSTSQTTAEIKTDSVEIIETVKTPDLSFPGKTDPNSFYERNGYVSIEAEHWTREKHSDKMTWKVIPDIGRNGSGISTFPVTFTSTLSSGSPRVEFDFYSYDSGACKIQLYFSPTLNFLGDEEGLKFAVSIDDAQPQVVSLNADDKNGRTWEGWVANNIIVKTIEQTLSKPGKHTLKYWMVSPAIVLQKAVIDFGSVKPSYLGPPETKMNN